MRKGQGLSLNVIIVAAIVLVVLIVLWLVFTGRIGLFGQGLEATEKNCKSLCTGLGVYEMDHFGAECTGDQLEARKFEKKEGEITRYQYCCCKKKTTTTSPEGEGKTCSQLGGELCSGATPKCKAGQSVSGATDASPTVPCCKSGQCEA